MIDTINQFFIELGYDEASANNNTIELIKRLDPMPAISGRYCVGYAFAVNDSYPVQYRRCGWDGQITLNEGQGLPCKLCQRIVKDTDLGIVPTEPCNAVFAWIEPIKQWVMVQV